jgi:hypothetical protein
MLQFLADHPITVTTAVVALFLWAYNAAHT